MRAAIHLTNNPIIAEAVQRIIIALDDSPVTGVDARRTTVTKLVLISNTEQRILIDVVATETAPAALDATVLERRTGCLQDS